MKGRKPLPKSLRILGGNAGKRPIKFDEPQFTGVPKCPTWLDQTAKKEFKRICKELEAVGMLTACDQGALAAYCVTYSRWVEAERQVSLHGITISEPITNKASEVIGQKVRRNPANIVASDCLRTLARYGSEFGFSPASRSRLSVTPNEQVDPLEDFLNGTDEDDESGAVYQ
jgi:P27 family predicted phage terminase small subunit